RAVIVGGDAVFLSGFLDDRLPQLRNARGGRITRFAARQRRRHRVLYRLRCGHVRLAPLEPPDFVSRCEELQDAVSDLDDLGAADRLEPPAGGRKLFESRLALRSSVSLRSTRVPGPES